MREKAIEELKDWLKLTIPIVLVYLGIVTFLLWMSGNTASLVFCGFPGGMVLILLVSPLALYFIARTVLLLRDVVFPNNKDV